LPTRPQFPGGLKTAAIPPGGRREERRLSRADGWGGAGGEGRGTARGKLTGAKGPGESKHKKTLTPLLGGPFWGTGRRFFGEGAGPVGASGGPIRRTEHTKKNLRGRGGGRCGVAAGCLESSSLRGGPGGFRFVFVLTPGGVWAPAFPTQKGSQGLLFFFFFSLCPYIESLGVPLGWDFFFPF